MPLKPIEAETEKWQFVILSKGSTKILVTLAAGGAETLKPPNLEKITPASPLSPV